MHVAIVILNWNGIKHLKSYLPSVVNYSKEYSVYLVDNASTDDSVAWVRQNWPEVQIIQHEENVGFCRGYNLGLRQIESKYYVLLNSDVEVTEGWIAPILAVLESQPNVAVCQPKILSLSERANFEYAGAAGGFIDWLGYPFCRGRLFDTVEVDQGQYDDPIELFWASGACFFIRSIDYHEIGGFDDSFFAHMEEIDLCWRLKNRGRQIKYVGESIVYHLGGGTLQQSSPFKAFLNFRNGLFLLYKNLPKKRLFSTIFIRLTLDGVAGVRYFIRLEFDYVWIIIKAHYHFYRYIWSKKVTRDNLTGIEAKDILYKSIVWEYFLKRKKTYQDIKS